jgi:hypothetical protein
MSRSLWLEYGYGEWCKGISTTTPFPATCSDSELSNSGHLLLAANATASEPEASYDLVAIRPVCRPLNSPTQDPAPISKRAILCQSPEVRAVCGNPARTDLCGGPRKPGSLPRPQGCVAHCPTGQKPIETSIADVRIQVPSDLGNCQINQPFCRRVNFLQYLNLCRAAALTGSPSRLLVADARLCQSR